MKLFDLFIVKENTKVTKLQAVVNIIIACAAFIGFFFWSVSRLGLALDFSVLFDFRYRLFYGFITTIELSIVSLVLSLLIGFVSALGTKSRLMPLVYFCQVYVQFIRGTPMIMQVYLFFYIIGTAWNITDRFIAGVLILSIFAGAYISEIIRGGLDSIDATQLEAAKAVGLDSRQTMRLVILPQLTARILPALAGQFASIIKDSSLLSLISVIELTQTVREISATNFAIFECYLFLGLLYLCLTFPLSMLTKVLERRFKYEN
jgi:polar amino acid transport system permease protein